MLFYKITAELSKEAQRRVKDDEPSAALKEQVLSSCAEYNRLHEDMFCFVSNLKNRELTGGMIANTREDRRGALCFVKALGVCAEKAQIREIRSSELRSLLYSADRHNYVDDSDDVMEDYNVHQLCTDYYKHRYDFEERLIDLPRGGINRDKLYAKASELLSRDSLKRELDQIYSVSHPGKYYGHPVQYRIESDIKEDAHTQCRILLSALYDAGRLLSRRYACIEIGRNRVPESDYDGIYRSFSGGAVAVFLTGPDPMEDEYSGAEARTIRVICDTMKKYRNKVQTLLCLPRDSEKLKRRFAEMLDGVRIVSIREECASYKEARVFLSALAKKHGLRADKALFESLETDKTYLPRELYEQFETWYDNKLHTSIFPQYKTVSLARRAPGETPKGSGIERLNEMIGLGEAKRVIASALDYYKFQKFYGDPDLSERPSMHMVFTGSPGTAKTTVARLFARILKENEVLSEGHLVEVGRSDLVGKYVGWTASIVKQKFKEARGGVLFIDEAYSLVDDKRGMYGDEAINTIVQEMENQRENLIVIFAGYSKEMEIFLERNPGLHSRVAFHVPFEDYTAKELCEIAKLIARDKHLILADDACDKLYSLFEDARRDPAFGNGRYVRNVLEQSAMNLAGRVLRSHPETLPKDAFSTITAQDVYCPEKTAAPVKAIGFAS